MPTTGVASISTTNYPGQVTSRQKYWADIILVYLLIFLSGSWRYNLADEKYLIIGFCLTLTGWYLYSDRKFSTKFILYLAIFAGFLMILNIYTDGSLALDSVISASMKLMVAYLVLRAVGQRFVPTYVNVITFLAVISLFGYLTDRLGLLDGVVRSLPRVGSMGYEGFLYVFRFPWHIDRNNSIFFEPGAYQIFLNAAIFMLCFVDTGFTRKKIWVCLAILTVTLLTTFSTTGFLTYAVIFVAFLLGSNLLTKARKLTVVAVIIGLAALMSAQLYTTVVVKVSDYLSADEYDFGYSAQNRSADAKTDLKVFKKYIFGLGHKEYKEQFGLAGRISVDEEGGSSNGVTKALAVFGLPFSLFLFGSYLWALNRILKSYIEVITAFVAFLMFLASESFYIMSPICFAIIAAAFVVGPQRLRERSATASAQRA